MRGHPESSGNFEWSLFLVTILVTNFAKNSPSVMHPQDWELNLTQYAFKRYD